MMTDTSNAVQFNRLPEYRKAIVLRLAGQSEFRKACASCVLPSQWGEVRKVAERWLIGLPLMFAAMDYLYGIKLTSFGDRVARLAA
jgi:hypothetical protein